MNVAQQLNIMDAIREGESLKQQGLLRAIEHADKTSPQWSQRAYNVAVEYVKSQLRSGENFKTEDIRIWAYLSDKIHRPPHERAWGAVCINMAKEGLIEKIGLGSVTNPKAHGAIATLWKKK